MVSTLLRATSRVGACSLVAFAVLLTLPILAWGGPELVDLRVPLRVAAPGAAPPLVAEPAERPEAKPPGPWRLAEQLQLPEWLHLSGSHRQRFEYVFHQFRLLREGDNRIWPIRTLLLGELRHEQFTLGAEFQDSRAYAHDSRTPVSTASVNVSELLQAYGKIGFANPSIEGFVRGGRITTDFGSRRLVARNRYRNTLNAFTGIESEITHKSGWFAKAMFALPIARHPFEPRKTEDNDAEFDREDEQVHFWAIFTRTPELSCGLFAELYCYGLNEDDVGDRPTQNRELYTPGFRLYRKPRVEQFDLQVETVLQFGHSRLDDSSTSPILNHFAFYVHSSVGYTLDTCWTPRLVAQFDYASGDRDPSDSHNGRFDTLYGARRFEYGPTGIFGAFARANIISPGCRVVVKPRKNMSSFLAYRPFWLAQQRDSWTTAALRDTSGDSGDFVGHQFDWRFRWDIYPENLRFECGAAVLLRGRFPRDVSLGNSGEPVVLYTQLAVSF